MMSGDCQAAWTFASAAAQGPACVGGGERLGDIGGDQVGATKLGLLQRLVRVAAKVKEEEVKPSSASCCCLAMPTSISSSTIRAWRGDPARLRGSWLATRASRIDSRLRIGFARRRGVLRAWNSHSQAAFPNGQA